MELFEPILHFFEQRWVHNIIWAGILAIGTAVATKVVSKTLRHLLNRDDNPLPASSIFINIARAVIWMIGGSFILDNCFGINANALVAALGVGGIAISLGFQDTLSNLIGGMQVTFMGIIKPGDNIGVGGVSGVVQDVTWRHTTIEDADGQFSLFEMKWNPKKANPQFPASFLSTYDVREQAIVTPENWMEWVL